jgi:hypothetical protein
MSVARALHAIACACVVAAIALPARATDVARELHVHGMSDTFAVPGVTLAWGVLRGLDDATTVVVIRIVANPGKFAAVAVTGVDPFTQRYVPLLPWTPISGRIELRVPRAHFAEFPRTNLQFDAAMPASRSDTPALVVYFLGVPDTTPEFAAEAALDAYLTDRLARARSAPATKPP